MGQISTITTAVPYLLLSPDAKSYGMGEAGVAATDDVNSTYWNLSALAFSKNKPGVGLNYRYPGDFFRNFGNFQFLYASVYSRLERLPNTTFGGSLRYASIGNITFTDPNGNALFTSSLYDLAADFGAAQKISDCFSMGLSLRYIFSDYGSVTLPGGIELVPGMAVSGDLNLCYRKELGKKLTGGEKPMVLGWGFNFSNIGTKIGYVRGGTKDYLPINMRGGIYVNRKIIDEVAISLRADFNKLMVPSSGGTSDLPVIEGMFSSFADAPGGFREEIREFNVSGGLELLILKKFALRAGIFNEDQLKGGRKFATCGIGFQYRGFGFDFSRYLMTLGNNDLLRGTMYFSARYLFQ